MVTKGIKRRASTTIKDKIGLIGSDEVNASRIFVRLKIGRFIDQLVQT